MNKTTTVKKEEQHPKWHLIDANGRVLGRVASDIASLLLGKQKPLFSSHINVGDKVVVTNAAKVVVTGTKRKNKIYNRNTGFPGGIRSHNFDEMMAKKPTEALRLAIKGMLPKNKLAGVRMANLYIYEGSEHEHNAQLSSKSKE